MKRFLTISLLISSFCLYAQEGEILKLNFEVRADYQQEYLQGEKIDPNSGFKGKYVNFALNGNITDNFTYAYRQRMIKPNKDASFFDCVDWATLTYNNRNWTISGGKQVVGIGGYEYDYAPIDIYFASEFWNNIACYQFGVSTSYTLDNGKDTFLLQFCESPFRKTAYNTEMKEMFAYNLMWTSTHGFFKSLYSVNMIEYLPGRFINYIVAGNQFSFRNVEIRLDVMNRSVCSDYSIGKDMSFIGEVFWSPLDRLTIFAKMSHDFNRTETTGDFCVLPGTEITRIGGGLEYYPLKNYRNIRLHLIGCYTFGETVPSAVLRPEQTIIEAGLTWKVNLLNVKRRNN